MAIAFCFIVRPFLKLAGFQTATLVARSASSASGHSSGVYGSSNYASTNQQTYERLANINNTVSISRALSLDRRNRNEDFQLSRASMRSGMGEYRVPGMPPNIDYRIPQVC